MTKEITKISDPLTASLENLLVVSFPKSTSKSYPLAVNIAKGANYYDEIIVGNKPVHFVVFGKTREEAGRAQALMNYVSGWKGVQIYSGGKIIQNIWEATMVIGCYLEASACKDWRAHCHIVIDDPYAEIPTTGGLSFAIRINDKPSMPKQAIELGRYIFPCSYLKPYVNFQKEHPSSQEDQIQAAAVEKGCDWCPLFDPKHYKKVSVRIIEKNFFE